MGESVPLHAQRFALPRPPWWSWWRLRLPLLAGVLVCAVVGAAGAGPLDEDTLVPLCIGAGVITWVVMVANAMVRSLQRETYVEVHGQGLRLPMDVDDHHPPPLTWDDVVMVDEPGKPTDAIVVTRGRVHRYPRAWFKPGHWEVIQLVLRRHVMEQPAGEQRLRAMAAEAQRTWKQARRPAVVTWFTGLLLLVIFRFLDDTALLIKDDHLVTHGGNVPFLVFAGEWYRLITANFLHLNAEHLFGNLFALWLVGRPVERVVGHTWLGIILALGGVSAQVAGLEGAHCVVGASGMVFAILGAWLALITRHRSKLPASLRAECVRITVVAVMLLMLDALGSASNTVKVHHAGHAAGAAVGFAVLFGRRRLSLFLHRQFIAVLTTACIAAWTVVAALAVAVWHPHPARMDVQQWLFLLAEERPGDAEIANNAAWGVATAEQPRLEDLAQAQELIRESLWLLPGAPPFLDTQATLHHRQGDDGRAVGMELKLLADGKGALAFYATQVARWSLDLMVTQPQWAERVGRALVHSSAFVGQDGTLMTAVKVQLPRVALSGFEVVAVIRDEEEGLPRLVFHACQGGGVDEQPTFLLPGPMTLGMGRHTEWETVVFLERGPTWDCDPSQGMWRSDGHALRLP